MLKRIKINKFRTQITEICNRHGYELCGSVRKCNIGENDWTFAVKTENKNIIVKLIVPFGWNNTGLCINSPEYISAVATLFGMRGLFGSIDIPITRKYHFKLPETAFGINVEDAEKVFLVYPKCTQFYVREKDSKQLTTFRVGLKTGDISIHDGASFKYFLENPNEIRKFAGFGE